MEVAEALVHLDPIRTYPQRGAEEVAKLVRASAFRLLRDGEKTVVSDPPPPPGMQPIVALPIRQGRESVGTLELFVDGRDRLGDDEYRLVRWGNRVFSRSLTHVKRLSQEGGRRDGESVRKALERAPLTPRERDVVELLVGGQSTRAIAQQTGLTVSTVNTYLKRIFSKLGVHSRVELVARMAGTAATCAVSPPPS